MHSFMNSDKRHKTPGSEIMDGLLLIATAVARGSALKLVPEAQFSQGNVKRARIHQHIP